MFFLLILKYFLFVIDITPSKAVALLHECGFNFKSKWSLLANILNVPLEQNEKMRAVIQEDEAYQYAVEIALDWWIKNTLESSWQELVSLVYRCGENDAANAMKKRLGNIIHLVLYVWPRTNTPP